MDREDSVSIGVQTHALLNSTVEAARIHETRKDRVAKIRRAVAESRYIVSPELVADRMLRALHGGSRGIE